jgi:hypothetical protein
MTSASSVAGPNVATILVRLGIYQCSGFWRRSLIGLLVCLCSVLTPALWGFSFAPGPYLWYIVYQIQVMAQDYVVA